MTLPTEENLRLIATQRRDQLLREMALKVRAVPELLRLPTEEANRIRTLTALVLEATGGQPAPIRQRAVMVDVYQVTHAVWCPTPVWPDRGACVGCRALAESIDSELIVTDDTEEGTGHATTAQD